MTKLSDYVKTAEAGLEQADYDVAASMGLPIAPGTPNSGKGPVVLGMFTAQGHVSFGEYYGSPDRSAIRDRFLHIVTQEEKGGQTRFCVCGHDRLQVL